MGVFRRVVEGFTTAVSSRELSKASKTDGPAHDF